MDIKDSYLHSAIGVVKSIDVGDGKLSYTLADVGNTRRTFDLAKAASIPFIVGTLTQATRKWTGNAPTIASKTDLYDGLTIRYWLPYNGSGDATLNLKLTDGTYTGDLECYYRGTTRLTTHVTAGTPVTLTYRKNPVINGEIYAKEGWWMDGDYDSDTGLYRNYSAKAFKTGASDLPAYNLIGVNKDGLLVPALTTPFLVDGPLYIRTSSLTKNKEYSWANLWERYNSITIKNGSTNLSLTTYKPLYLKGTILGGLFTAIEYTQILPTTEDGKAYLYIGEAVNSTSISFSFVHPIYIYKGGTIQTYSGYSTLSSRATLADTVSCTVGSSNAYRPIVVTNESSGLFYNSKITANYETGDLKATTFTGKLAYTNLTGSTTTANQAIVSNGTANGWTLKTLGSNAFNSTAYLPLSGGTLTGALTIKCTADAKLILDNIDTETNFLYIDFRQNNTSYGTLGITTVGGTNLQWSGKTLLHTGNYSTTLDGRYYTESEIDTKLGNYVTLNTAQYITGSKNFNSNSNENPLKISRNGGNTECLNIGADDLTSYFHFIQNEKIANFKFIGEWNDTENSDGSDAGSKYVTFLLSKSEAKILLNDGTNTHTVLHSGIAYIKDGKITINGVSITPLTSHLSLNNYVTLNTAQTITGAKTFTASTNVFKGEGSGMLTVNRNSTNPAWVKFMKDTTTVGYLGIRNDGTPTYGNSEGTSYVLLHSNNYKAYLPILNSASTHATNTSVIYAPTTAGTKNLVLLSNGSGAPVWGNLNTLSVGSASNGVFYIEGTATTDGVWLGSHDGITDYYKGLTIAYKIPRVGISTGTTININNKGAKPIYVNATQLTTHYASGATILLVYDGTYFRATEYWDGNTYSDCWIGTAANTAAKTANSSYYTLRTGNTFVCTVRYTNTAASALTLNIDGLGAKPIYLNGTATSSTNYSLKAGKYLVYYDGTNYYFYDNGAKIPDTYGNADTVDNYHIINSGVYKYELTVSLETTSVWYVTIKLTHPWEKSVSKLIFNPNYVVNGGATGGSNTETVITLYRHNARSWYALSTGYNENAISDIYLSSNGATLKIYLKMLAPKIKGYCNLKSPFVIESMTASTTAPSGITFTPLNTLGFTNLIANKLGESTIGSATKPIYLNAGTPTACNVDTSVTSGSANLITSGGVYTAINNVNTSLGNYVKKAGDTMTGDLTLYASSGDSPSLIFQRGSLTNDSVDYRHRVVSGHYKLEANSSNPTEWKEALSIYKNEKLTTPCVIQSTVAEGTAPFIVASTKVNTNLNADLLDGVHKGGLLTALTSTRTTNLSITVGGTTKTVNNLYATVLNVIACSKTDAGVANINSGLWSALKSTDSNYVGTFNVYDVYNDEGPTMYGNVIEVVSSKNNHWLPQLWLGSGKNGLIYYRNKLYNDNTWGNWNRIAYTTDNFPSNQINALTGYAKATSASALATTDSLNTALGKLEYKADTAYSFITGANDGDATIENLKEILDVLTGIKATDTISALINACVKKAGDTMTGLLNVLAPNVSTVLGLRATTSDNISIAMLCKISDAIHSGFIVYRGNSTYLVTDNGWKTSYNLLHEGNYTSYVYSKTQSDNKYFLKPASNGLDGLILHSNGTATPIWKYLQASFNVLDYGSCRALGTGATCSFDKSTGIYTVTIPSGTTGYQGILFTNMTIPWGKKLTVRFEIYSTTSATLYVDHNCTGEGLSGNDNYANQQTSVSITANDWNECYFSHDNTNTTENPNKVDLVEGSVLYGGGTNGITYKIRNVRAYYGDCDFGWHPTENDLSISTLTLSATSLTVGNVFSSKSVNIPTWNQSTTGNAATATKLATARTIWGQSFDGSADITGDLTIDASNDVNRYITFDSKGNGYDWRIGYLGSGLEDANYFVLENNGSGGKSWLRALQIGLTSLTSTFGGNVVPKANNTQTLGTSGVRWKNVYSVLGNFSGQITSTVASGTAPFVVSSTTKVNNLNVSYLDGHSLNDVTARSAIAREAFIDVLFDVVQNRNAELIVETTDGYPNITKDTNNKITEINTGSIIWSSVANDNISKYLNLFDHSRETYLELNTTTTGIRYTFSSLTWKLLTHLFINKGYVASKDNYIIEIETIKSDGSATTVHKGVISWHYLDMSVIKTSINNSNSVLRITLIKQDKDASDVRLYQLGFYSNRGAGIYGSNEGFTYRGKQSLTPIINNVWNLGTSSYKWKNVYATTFYGTLSGNATSASKVSNALTLQFNGTTNQTYDGSSAKTFNVNLINSGSGLLHNGLTTTIANFEEGSTDTGWKMICPEYSTNGFILKSIRTGSKTPDWILGDYSAGIAFGGEDTKGVISLRYNTPEIEFAGGNKFGVPTWWIKMTGTTGKTYNLNNFLTSRCYIGTTAVQASSAAQALTGITNISMSGLISINNTTRGTDLGTIIQGKTYKIGFLIGNGNENRGIYDYNNNKWALNLDSSGNVKFTGTTYFGGGTTYYFGSAGSVNCYALTSNNTATFKYNTILNNSFDPYLTFKDTAASLEMGKIYYVTSYDSTNKKYRNGKFLFRLWSYTTNTATKLNYYEEYELPNVATGLTSNKSYTILTTKNPGYIGTTAVLASSAALDLTGIKTIASSVATSTHLNGNRGAAVIKTTSVGYTMLASMPISTGCFTHGSWSDAGAYVLAYTKNETIEAGTNATTHIVLLLTSDGYTKLKNVSPLSNNAYSLGTSSYKWENVYATTFNGDLTGNATSATKINIQNIGTLDMDTMRGDDYRGTVWYGAGGNSAVNNPVGDTLAFGMLIWRNASGYTALLIMDSSAKLHVRLYTGSAWSALKTFAFITDITKSQVGLGNVQNTAFYKRIAAVNGTNWEMAGTNNSAAFTIFAPTTAGTAGQVLVSSGSGAPTWGSPSGLTAGSLTPIQLFSGSVSVSSSGWTDIGTGTSTVKFASTDTGTYAIQITSGTNFVASGIFSVYKNLSNVSDEIPLHVCTSKSTRLYLRTMENKLLIASNDTSATSWSITIKIAKIL